MASHYLPYITDEAYPEVGRICENRIPERRALYMAELEQDVRHTRTIGEERRRWIKIEPHEILPFCKLHRCRADGQALLNLAYEKGTEQERAPVA